MVESDRGTTTILFTDQVGSVSRAQRIGEDAAEALRRTHFNILRQAIAGHGGHEVKNVGDGLMAVFRSALEAVACAVEMQRAVALHNAKAGVDNQLDVKVGIEVGEPSLEDDDYFGTPVAIASRLCGLAAGGQIIASDVLRSLCGTRGGHRFAELGGLKIKGIDEPFRAVEVLWNDQQQPRSTSAVAVTDAAPRELPVQLDLGGRTAFVGRDRERAQLAAAWARVQAGRPRLVVIEGESGIGKTRLVAEFAREAHAKGAPVAYVRYEPFAAAAPTSVARVRCDAGTREVQLDGRPAQLVLSNQEFELLRLLSDADGRLCSRAELGDTIWGAGNYEYNMLHRLVHRLKQKLDPLLPGAIVSVAGAGYRLDAGPTQRPGAAGENVSRAAVSNGQASILVLDDIQWADAEAQASLRALRQELSASPVLVLATFRPGEPGDTTTFTQLLSELRRDGLAERLRLDGLEEADVAHLIDAWSGSSAPSSFAQAVFERTDGNPFFVEETLRNLAETGAIYDEAGALAVPANLQESGVPETIKEAVSSRVARLSDDCLTVLKSASVLGREFELPALERLHSELGPDAIVGALDEAIASRLIQEVPHQDGRYSFMHALVRDALYYDMSDVRRLRLHQQTLSYAERDGVRLAYQILGSNGPYIVAVGVTACVSLRLRVGSRNRRWQRIARFARVLLYDRRGVGYSSAPEHGYSVRASMDDLTAVLDAAGVERVILWGGTDGGPLAIAYAAEYPARVAGLVLVGTSASVLSRDDFPWGFNQSAVAAFTQTDPVDQVRATSELTEMRSRRFEETVPTGELIRRIPRPIWTKVIGGVVSVDARAALSHLSMPVLIIHAESNGYAPVGAAHYLHEQIKGSELLITEEAESPEFGETIYAAAEAFCERAGRGALVG